MYKISIITVVYNAGAKIKMTLDSIFNQIYKDYEILIIDGASKDDTLSIVQTYLGLIPNLRLYSEPDKGVYDAMNKGINKAKGEYVFFLNAGDVFFDNHVLSSVGRYLNGLDIVYGNAYTYDDNNILKPYRVGKFNKYRLANTNMCHQTIFYPLAVIKNNQFNLRYCLFADYDLNIRLWGRNKFVSTDINMVKYEGGGISATCFDDEFERVYLKKVRKYLGVDALFYLLASMVVRKISRLFV